MSTVLTLARYLSCHSLSRHCAITIMANWLERSTLSPDSICDPRPRDSGASSCVKARRSSNRPSLLALHSGIRPHPFNTLWSTTPVVTSSMMHGGEPILVLVQTFHIQTQVVLLNSMAMVVMAASTWILTILPG